MKVVSQFSGIGMIDLGLETLGWETVAHFEYDPGKNGKPPKRQYADEVMRARFPNSVSCGDITKVVFGKNRDGVPGILLNRADGGQPEHKKTPWEILYKGPVDIITGGFPCQDISNAGKGAGIKEGTRSGLWKTMFESIKQLRPRGVLIENVAALAGKGLDIVLADLASIGYDAEWDVIAAAGVGAPHLRERIFIVAWPAETANHGVWPEPPVVDAWLEEPEGVPRLTTEKVVDRVSRLRCLGNSVVPQVAAYVGSILRDRLEGGYHEDGDDFSGDTIVKRGEHKGDGKIIGWMGDSVSPPDEDLVGAKLPRAGRLTAGWVVERDRVCTQAFAKKRGLTYMAATLRPRVEGMPPLIPTPSASNPNDGEDPATWLERKAHHAGKDEGATRASMPLGVAAKLIPTPTVKDGDSSRNASAVRSDGAVFKPGTTLTDFVDPTNGGRLLPTPKAGDHKGAGPLDRRPVGDDSLSERVERIETGDARLLPTPRATDGDKGIRSHQGAVNEMARGKGGDLPTAAALLPTPTVADSDRSSDTYARGNDTLVGAARQRDLESYGEDKLLPTPRAGKVEGYASPNHAPTLKEVVDAKESLLPTPTSRDGSSGPGHADSAQGSPNLRTVAGLLPTPRACTGLRSSGLNRSEIMTALEQTDGADKLIPTPRASEWKGVGPLGSASHDYRLEKGYLDATVQDIEQATGKLYPNWVEWLMGVPQGWTDLT